jgi:hypothetical protein
MKSRLGECETCMAVLLPGLPSCEQWHRMAGNGGEDFARRAVGKYSVVASLSLLSRCIQEANSKPYHSGGLIEHTHSDSIDGSWPRPSGGFKLVP